MLNTCNMKSGVTSKKQQELWDLYIETKDDSYRVKISVSYVKLIAQMVNDFRLRDPEDVLCQVLTIVYNSLGKYDNTRATIYTYIYRIINTKIIDIYRRQKRVYRGFVDIEDDKMIQIMMNDDDPDHKCQCQYHIESDFDTICCNEEKLMVNKVIKLLTPEEQIFVSTVYWKGFGIAKTMKELHMSRKAYDIINKRVNRKLKRKLKTIK